MKSLWSLLWLSSTHILFREGDQHLSKDMPSFLSLPVFHLSLLISILLSLSIPCEIFTSSFSSLLQLSSLSPAPFTSCPPLWSGHGSCLYLTNRGGPIPLAPGLWSPWMQGGGIWKEEMCVCVCVCGIGGAFICVYMYTHSETHMHAPSIQEEIVTPLPVIPRLWYYSVISTKWLRGRFHRRPPVTPTLSRFLLFLL